MIRFFVSGIPKSMSVGKSVSFQRKGSNVRQHFQKRENSDWALLVGHMGREHAPAAPLEGALILFLKFYVPKPASIPRREWFTAMPIKRPDLDNLMHKLGDSFNGVFWHDDSQITDIYTCKRYPVPDSERSVTGVEFIVAPFTNAQLQAEISQILLDMEPARS
jgi:Holliday junction resolvase RusA-like endonuclease